MQRPVAGSAQVKAPRGVEQRRELGPPVALALRRDRRELLADVLGGDHSDDPLEREQPALDVDARAAVAADAVRGDDAMARDEKREAVRRAEGACRARGTGAAGERGELAVRDDLAARDGAQRVRERALERRRPAEVDGSTSAKSTRRRRPGTHETCRIERRTAS